MNRLKMAFVLYQGQQEGAYMQTEVVTVETEQDAARQIFNRIAEYQMCLAFIPVYRESIH